MKMSCRYLGNVLSRQDNSKTILRCLEDVLCQLGYSLSEFFRQKDAYSAPRQKSKMEFFVETVHSLRWLTNSVISSILDVGLNLEYASADSNPLSNFSKNETADLFAS